MLLLGCTTDKGTEDFRTAEELSSKYFSEPSNKEKNKDVALLAIDFYAKAAKKGNLAAQLNLGKKYYTGHFGYFQLSKYKNTIIQQNYTEARSLFEKAAKQDSTEANYYLAWMFLNGNGGKIDIEKAKVIFKRTRQEKIFWEGYKKHILNYLNPAEESQNYELLTTAAELGDPISQCKLGLGLLLDNDMNTRRAIDLIKKSVLTGYTDCQYWLARAYYDGLGVVQNYKKAYVWSSINNFIYQSHAANNILLEELKTKLPIETIIQGQELTEKCINSGYKHCM